MTTAEIRKAVREIIETVWANTDDVKAPGFFEELVQSAIYGGIPDEVQTEVAAFWYQKGLLFGRAQNLGDECAKLLDAEDGRKFRLLRHLITEAVSGRLVTNRDKLRAACLLLTGLTERIDLQSGEGREESILIPTERSVTLYQHPDRARVCVRLEEEIEGVCVSQCFWREATPDDMGAATGEPTKHQTDYSTYKIGASK